MAISRARAVDGVRGQLFDPSHRRSPCASIGYSGSALRRACEELARKRVDFFFFIQMTGRYQRASHFISRRWLRLLNTDNSVGRAGGDPQHNNITQHSQYIGMSAVDPADLRAQARAELGLSRELVARTTRSMERQMLCIHSISSQIKTTDNSINS